MAGNCKSKVGVRLPHGMFNTVVAVLENYANMVEKGEVVSVN